MTSDPAHLLFPSDAPAEHAAAEKRLGGGGDPGAIADAAIGVLHAAANSAAADGGDHHEKFDDADLRAAYRFLADVEIVRPGTVDAIEGTGAGDSDAVTRAAISQAKLHGYQKGPA